MVNEEDFCLSEKLKRLPLMGYPEGDAKKFIEIISNEFIRRFYGSNMPTIEYDEFLAFIKKKAGKNLT